VSARAANLLGAHALVVADRMRAAAGMELSSAAVLTALQTYADGASIDALRRMLGLSHSGGVRIVRRLEAEGLVRRVPDPEDGRAVRLHLTPAGRRTARRLLGARQAALEPLLAGLREAERAALERLLERLLAGVAHGPEDANRICRLCDPGVCGHPGRCPVTIAVTGGG
jgi:MarR family transcriptional regulator, negative regulator of the multidrug operon emrRAB